jgi:hypothetical protein
MAVRVYAVVRLVEQRLALRAGAGRSAQDALDIRGLRDDRDGQPHHLLHASGRVRCPGHLVAQPFRHGPGPLAPSTAASISARRIDRLLPKAAYTVGTATPRRGDGLDAGSRVSPLAEQRLGRRDDGLTRRPPHRFVFRERYATRVLTGSPPP